MSCQKMTGAICIEIKYIRSLMKRFSGNCMQGWLQTLSRYGLFKETLRVFLQNLRKQKPGLYEDISKGLSRNYLDKEFDLTEKDHEKAQREVKRMAQDLYAVYTVFDKHHQVNQYESFKTLVTVFQQQCEVVENPEKTVREVVIREKPRM